MEDIKIKKFSYNAKDKETKVEYSFYRDNGDEVKTTLTSFQKPTTELILQMSVLTKDVEKICSLPTGYCIDAEVRSVSFSHSHDILGAVITCLVPIETANSPVVINTPHLPSAPYNECSESPVLPSETAFKLKVIHKLVIEYINGDRQPEVDNQTKLDL